MATFIRVSGGRDAHVGGEHERESAACRSTMRQAHNRLRATPHTHIDFTDLTLESQAGYGPGADPRRSFKIVTGAERAPGATEHHNTDILARFQTTEIVLQLIAHLWIDGVQFVRAVQGQPFDCAVALYLDGLVIHVDGPQQVM